MRSMKFWIVVLAVGGCDATPGSVTSFTEPTDPAETPLVPTVECAAIPESVSPIDQEASVPLDTEVVVTFSEAVPEGGVTVGVAGVPGTSFLAEDGLSITWLSDSDLEPDTEYTIEANVCGVLSNTVFTTVGEPIEVVDVSGKTYAVAWTSLTFVEPPKGGPIVADAVNIDDVLLQFASIDELTNEAELLGALSVDTPNGDPRPFCDELIEVTTDFSSNPSFTFGPETISVPLNIDADGNVTESVQIEDLEIQFEVSGDGTELLNPNLRGLIAVEDLVSEPCEESFVVTLAKGTCLPCTIAPSEMCLLVDATATSADEVADFDLQGVCTPL